MGAKIKCHKCGTDDEQLYKHDREVWCIYCLFAHLLDSGYIDGKDVEFV